MHRLNREDGLTTEDEDGDEMRNIAQLSITPYLAKIDWPQGKT